MHIAYKSEASRGRRWQALCAEQAPERTFYLWPLETPASDIHYLIAWQPPADVYAHFPNLKVLFSVGAGVDQLALDALPGELPVVRMIDPGLTQGMVEYVTCGVLALQRDLPAYLAQQREHHWQPRPQRPAGATRVGVMGLGELGQAALAQLQQLGFACRAWTRSPRSLAGVAVYSGADELADFLAGTDILVCLLPLTEQTRGILDAALLRQLPEQAGLVHVGRGAQLIGPDLLAALDANRLQAAIVDVVDPEPLPEADPLWDHPRLWLTPHVASSTQADTAFQAILDNIRRYENNQPMHGHIDRERGY